MRFNIGKTLKREEKLIKPENMRLTCFDSTMWKTSAIIKKKMEY